MYLPYDTIRSKTLEYEELRHLQGALLSFLCATGSAFATWYFLTEKLLPAFTILFGILAIVFIIAFTIMFGNFFSVKAEKPASMAEIKTFMHLAERSEARDELLEELERLIRVQGELYKYQAYTLILAARRR